MKITISKGTNLEETEYKKIKEFLKMGMKITEIMKIPNYNRSYGTLKAIEKSEDYQNYKDKTKEKWEKRKAVIAGNKVKGENMEKENNCINEQEFNKIKGLLNLGWNITDTAKIAKRSTSAISTINQFPNLEAYLNSERERLEKYKKEKAQVIKPEPISSEETTNGIIGHLEKLNQGLELIKTELFQIKKTLIEIDTTLRLARTEGRIRLA